MRKSRIGIRRKRRKVNIILIIFFFIILPITAVTIGSRITERLVIPTINTENMLQAPGNIDLGNSNPTESHDEEERNSAVEDSDQEEINVDRVKLNSLLAYTIQVVSLSDNSNIESFTRELENHGFPHIIYKIEDTYKIYTYGATNREKIEGKLETIREVYPDAYIGEIYVPEKEVDYLLDSEEGIKGIVNDINSLIEIVDQSSNTLFQYIHKEGSLEDYNQILVNHKEVLGQISEKINSVDEDTESINIDIIKNMIEYQNKSLEESLNMKEDIDEFKLQKYFLENLFRLIEVLRNN